MCTIVYYHYIKRAKIFLSVLPVLVSLPHLGALHKFWSWEGARWDWAPPALWSRNLPSASSAGGVWVRRGSLTSVSSSLDRRLGWPPSLVMHLWAGLAASSLMGGSFRSLSIVRFYGTGQTIGTQPACGQVCSGPSPESPGWNPWQTWIL